MLSYLKSSFALALRLSLRLRLGGTVVELLLALLAGVFCARNVKSEKARRALRRYLPLAAVGLEILEILLVPLQRGGNWGLVAGHCAFLAVLLWLGFLLASLFSRGKRGSAS